MLGILRRNVPHRSLLLGILLKTIIEADMLLLKRFVTFGLMVSALVGAIMCAWLVMEPMTAPGTATVNTGAVVNGSGIPSSKRLGFRGTRVEFAGLALFGALLAIELSVRKAPEEVQHRLRFHAYVLSTLALGIVVWILIDGGFSRAAWQYWVCAACITAGFLVASISQQSAVRDVLRKLLPDSRQVLLAKSTWVIGVLVVGILATRPAASNADVKRGQTPEEFEAWFDSQPKKPAPAIGEAAGKVIVLGFNDYQCPGCRSSSTYHRKLFDELNQKYPGRIELRMLDFPLDAECNPYGKDLHGGACEAAAAARLAAKQGRLVETTAWLWANQRELTRERVFEAARSTLGLIDLESLYDGLIAEIREDVEIANSLGVRGTPSFFYDGVVVDFVPRVHFARILERRLRTFGSAPGD